VSDKVVETLIYFERLNCVLCEDVHEGIKDLKLSLGSRDHDDWAPRRRARRARSSLALKVPGLRPSSA